MMWRRFARDIIFWFMGVFFYLYNSEKRNCWIQIKSSDCHFFIENINIITSDNKGIRPGNLINIMSNILLSNWMVLDQWMEEKYHIFILIE